MAVDSGGEDGVTDNAYKFGADASVMAYQNECISSKVIAPGAKTDFSHLSR